MKTVDEIRRERLAELVQEFGTIASMADAIGCSPAQLSQWLNASKDSRTGRPRGMRADSARMIERKCGRPTGWLDGGETTEVAVAVQDTRYMAATPFERAILDIARAVPDEQKQRFLGWLEAKIENLHPDPTADPAKIQGGGRDKARSGKGTT